MSSSERLWSEEVGMCDPDALSLTPDIAYEFSNGAKRFETKKLPMGLSATSFEVHTAQASKTIAAATGA